MFAGIENTQANPRRGWTALASFTLQAAAVAVALTIPLLHPNSLPEAFAHRRIFVPITSPAIETTTANHPAGGNRGLSPSVPPIFVTRERAIHFPGPSVIPGPVGPPTVSFSPASSRGFPGPNLGTERLPVLHQAIVNPIRVSRSMQGYLIRRVEPGYPVIARTAGVQGVVLIKALISTEGRIEQAQVLRGSPLLAKAALDAIQQWRYRPYYLNDKPVEVETEITVDFRLSR
jgi:protein TonB